MKKKKIYFVILILILIALDFLYQEYKYSNVNYFPDNIFDQNDLYNDFVVQWYSKNLKALREPSIYTQIDDKNKNIFRFTLLRSFGNPISIRLEINEKGTGLLYCRVTCGLGGYHPGFLIKNTEKKINKENVGKLLKLINETDFWNLPTRDDVGGMDGAQWIIEGLSEGKYHLVDRWSPEEGEVREIGMELLKLSGLKVKEVY